MTGKIRPDGYNPIQELGLYYLRSRYYNPTWGRFINADALVSTGQGILGNNMFAYCRNNPVIRKDISGTNDLCVVNGDDDNPLDDLGYPSGGGGGSVAGVSSSYYAMQNVRAYDSWWRNSGYNPNMSWSRGTPSPQAANVSQATTRDIYTSRGSTGRTEPLNLKEKLAMEQVQASPRDGAKELPIRMTDPRWPATEGWIKMAYNVNGVEIHFVYNPLIQAFDDFKFKGETVWPTN